MGPWFLERCQGTTPSSPGLEGGPQTSVRETHRPSAPPRLIGVWKAYNTYNQLSAAKLNYGCICFLMFPRWFARFGGFCSQLQRSRFHSSLKHRQECFLPGSGWLRCVRIHKVAVKSGAAMRLEKPEPTYPTSTPNTRSPFPLKVVKDVSVYE